MARFLRAWAWVRWRTIMNAIERSERVDRVQRLSRALEALGPVLVAVMMIPSALMAMTLGAAAGFGLGSGAAWGVPLMHAMRIVLFLVVALTVLGPVLLPSGRGLASLPRLLLLPVPHRTLYTGEMLGGFAEPWILLGALMAVMVPAGALAAGHLTLAAVSLAGAAALVTALIALGAFFGALLHMLMRDRRRGEWILVLVFTLIPLLALLPSTIAGDPGTRRDRREREAELEARMEQMFERPASGLLAALPSELFIASGARAAGRDAGHVALPLAGLVLMAAGATAGGWAIWKRTIDRGGISRGRARSRGESTARSPWMRSVTLGLAFTFLQHVLRTARGRITVLPSIVITVVFGTLIAVRGGVTFGAIPLRHGFAVALFGVVMAFMSSVQLWMNQFAIDKAGLTMLCLQPLSSARIVRGKMAGAAMLMGVMAGIPMAGGLLIGAPVPAAYWILLLVSAVAGFLVIAPLAALLSIYFGKSVDLTSIGQRSNAHAAAGLLGGLLIFAAAGPGVGAGLLGARVLDSQMAIVALAAGWLLIALLLHWVFTRVAIGAFERRRETLVAVASGK
ncbi:MAG: hypothetical protein M3R55_03950 [Acidobacteriota bacterium]|nr:hypothetical protein [Acidobacteriota bacterium]